MTHWREWDVRHSWTFAALQALDDGIEKLLAEQPDGWDIVEELEEVVGLAFVALQNYITRTEEDLITVHGAAGSSRQDIRSQHCALTSENIVRPGDMGGANYYKHHEEWPSDWKLPGRHAESSRSLMKLGISNATESPCIELKKALNADTLIDLLSVVSNWREKWFSQLRR